MVIVVGSIARCIIFGVPRLPIHPCDERPPAMYGHFCLVPRVSVHDRYYCIGMPLFYVSLKPDTPNTHVEPDGFTVYRVDRTVDSGKELGTGGVCLFVNNRWCNNVTVKDKKCTPKLELIIIIVVFSIATTHV